MCNKRSSVLSKDGFRIDPCMRDLVEFLRKRGIDTLACCCGHGRYKQTVVISWKGGVREYNSLMVIPRKKRFYRRDKDGFFYIPEVDEVK